MGFSVAGQGAALIAAVIAVPIMLHALGTPRFGVLTLALVVIGYAGIFDFGLGRALTTLTSERIGASRDEELPPLFWTTLVLTTVVGLVLMLAAAAATPWLAGSVLKIPEDLRSDAELTLLLLAVSIPVLLVSSALRGYMEAYQRFDLLMGVTVVMAVLSYGGPAVLVQFVPSLLAVVGLLVASRVLACIALFALCLRIAPALHREITFRRSLVGPLARFGAWVNLTNIATSTIQSLDRFVIGALISASAVAYYAAPIDAVTKMLILSAALGGVLFPAFVMNFHQDPERTARLFGKGTAYAFLTLFPMALVIVTLAPEILGVWLGGDFPDRSAFVMQWAAVGVLMTGMAQIVYGFVQSVRPDFVAKLAAAELPVYLLAFIAATSRWGIDGAVVVYTVRNTVDALALSLLAIVIQPAVRSIVRRQTTFALVAVLCFAAAGQLEGIGPKLVFLASVLIVAAVLAWRLVIDAADRATLRGRAKLVFASLGRPPV